MRRSISKIPYRPSTVPPSIAAPFCTSSGDGGGRGRTAPNPFSFTVPPSNDSKTPSPAGQGHGRGRGASVNPSPVRHEFSAFVNNDSSSAPSGRGRGRGRGGGFGFALPNIPRPAPPPSRNGSDSNVRPSKPSVKMPFHFVEQSYGAESGAPPAQEKAIPTGILGALSGSGRGKPTRPHAPPPSPHPDRTRLAGDGGRSQSPNMDTTVREQWSPDEKAKRAMEKLNKGDRGGGFRVERGGGFRVERGGERGGMTERGGGRGARGRGMSVRGGGRGARGGRGGGYGRREIQDAREEFRKGQYFKDPFYEEKLAHKIGSEKMKQVYEGLDEMTSRVLTDPKEDALVEAYETNLRLECEPEFFMEEFGTNPDIAEKAQIPLRDALEKMKPFLMVYEKIQSNEEWEEIMEETMKKVPLVKGIIDQYGGPDRVTAKEQCEELEQAAKTLPASTPASLKRFADRAVLSLQSNPGWGFNKKSQFMDKLIMEVEQNYK